MYAYHNGQELGNQAFQIKTLSMYHKNQTLHLERMEEQHDHRQRIFGPFGLGTWVLVITASLTLQSMNLPELLEALRKYGLLLYSIGMLWNAIRNVRYTFTSPGAKHKLLPRVSENGLPLTDLDYDPHHDYTDGQWESFGRTYYDLALDTTKPQEHTPLKTPVLVEGQEVVAAYVNVELSNESGKPGADYRIQLADGTGVQVDADTFATMTSTIYETADGEEFLIPVLGGRNRSLRWGAVSDAMAAERLLRNVPRTPQNREYVIRLIDEVICYHERALHMLRVQKAPNAPELPTTAPLEAYAASFEHPAE